MSFYLNDGYKNPLKVALENILFSNDVKYRCMATKKGKKKKTPFYVLPVISCEERMNGIIMLDDEMEEYQLGFMQRNNHLPNNYYNANLEGRLEQVSLPEDDSLYLPIKKTKGCLQSIREEGSKRDSRLNLMGIDLEEGIYPLFLAEETDEGVRLKGIYQGAKKKPFIFDLEKNAIPDIEEVLGQIKEFSEEDPLELQPLTDQGENYPLVPVKRQSPITARMPGELLPGQTTDLYPLEKRDLEEVRPAINKSSRINWEDPKSIVEYLDEYVIGQESAKKNVAVAFSNYMIKALYKDDGIRKNNMLLIGPSGTGKTYMLSLLAKESMLPMTDQKLTGTSTEGFRGQNLSGVFNRFKQKANGDEEAPYGIIFFDEIDKLAKGNLDNGFEGPLQRELIGWIEEAEIGLDNSSGNFAGDILNTKNILFVFAGAFQDRSGEGTLEEIIKKRLYQPGRMGFGEKGNETPDEKDILHKFENEDLIKYGLMTELIGRLTARGVCNLLETKDMIKILKEAKESALKSNLKLAECRGYDLKLENGVLEAIADSCPRDTGARALNEVCDRMFMEIHFDPEKYAKKKIIRVDSKLALDLIKKSV